MENFVVIVPPIGNKFHSLINLDYDRKSYNYNLTIISLIYSKFVAIFLTQTVSFCNYIPLITDLR